MSGIFVGFGRIIGVKTKSAEELNTSSNLLELSVSVDTGEMKKEGMQYAPSNIYSVSLWGKRADALVKYAEEGKHVFFKGHLSVPQTYLKDGEPRCQLRITDVDELKVVNVVYDQNGGSAKEDSAPAAASAAKGKKKAAPKADFEDETDLSDLDFS